MWTPGEDGMTYLARKSATRKSATKPPAFRLFRVCEDADEGGVLIVPLNREQGPWKCLWCGRQNTADTDYCGSCARGRDE